MKLGSLFDGSGGFPLAGRLNGVEPVWASEIEPYPIAVTRSRFPNMKHLGDITKIDGSKIEPVDIITFGSPCQDLSVAGKQAGLQDGVRSNLFYQAIRIIMEMRDKANGLYPAFAVWENVPGAFSSNKGQDFRSVLEALARISDTEVSIPMCEKRWQKAGDIVGDGWPIAWRTLDAQFWGVPQRRKRIYLVADFNSERAGEILFERYSVPRDIEESGAQGQGTATDAQGSAGGSCGPKCLNPWDSQTIRQYDAKGVYPAITSNATGGQNRQGVVYPINTQVITRHNALGRGTGFGAGDEGDPAYTLQAGHEHGVVYAVDGYNAALSTESSSIGSNCGTSTGRNGVVYALQANGIDRADTAGCNGSGWRENESYTLNTVDRHAVCYSCGNGQSNMAGHVSKGKAGTLDTMHDQQIVLYENHAKDSRIRECIDVSPTILQMYGTGGNNTPLVQTEAKPPRRYIIRRLMPVECARLQGFPDWWGELAPYDGDDAFWRDIYGTWCDALGKKHTPKKNIQGWYEKLHTDSAEYKMWGNGIALPCAEFVVRRISEEIKRRSD